MRIHAIAAATIAAAIFLTSEAMAVTPFECGVSRVFGKLYVTGVLEKNRSKIDMKVKRAPLLVLWSGTSSQTIIPLKISDDLRERLEAIGSEPMSGRFEVSINEHKAKPSWAELLDYAMPSAEDLDKPETVKPVLLKKGGCSK